MSSRSARRTLGLVLAGALVAAETWVLARRRGRVLTANTVVRCRGGHLFTTWWIPGASLKAIRLGPWRYQRCPVGRHWALVTPVDPSTLGAGELESARRHDVAIP